MIFLKLKITTLIVRNDVRNEYSQFQSKVNDKTAKYFLSVVRSDKGNPKLERKASESVYLELYKNLQKSLNHGKTIISTK